MEWLHPWAGPSVQVASLGGPDRHTVRCCLTPVHGAWGAQKPTGEVHHCLPRASLCGMTKGWSRDLSALAGCPLLSLPQATGCRLVCERETCRGH